MKKNLRLNGKPAATQQEISQLLSVEFNTQKKRNHSSVKRVAYIIGSNGPSDLAPLEYARKDAEKIAKVLSNKQCQYETQLANEHATSSEIREELFRLADSCDYTDTFLCYFSGHGFIEQGELMLLTDQSKKNQLLATTLAVADLVRAANFCKAKNKLLILDCCHAGAVAAMPGFKDIGTLPISELGFSNESFLILMASGKLEKARESAYFSGGFLTSHICDALGNPKSFPSADHDGDGVISTDDLRYFLEYHAMMYNKNNPDTPLPIPEIFGRQKGPVYLTTGSRHLWQPVKIQWPLGIEMVVLPLKPLERSGMQYASCISRTLVTNCQYRAFIKSTGNRPPVGEHFVKADEFSKWQGPFEPMNEDEFCHPDQPVVCVSYSDVAKFCNWLNDHFSNKDRAGGHAHLPRTNQWDFAAFGSKHPRIDLKQWLTQNEYQFHHRSNAPLAVTSSEARTNKYGISDMIGNVWEWCEREDRILLNPAILAVLYNPRAEEKRSDIYYHLRGGSFLDDLSQVDPVLYLHEKSLSGSTRHSDLGFRIAANIPLQWLEQSVQDMLYTFNQGE